MKNEDIEQLLQQYGADLNRQQQAVSQVRHLARMQARRRIVAASMLLVLLGTVWAANRLSPTPVTGRQPLVAQQFSPAVDSTPTGFDVATVIVTQKPQVVLNMPHDNLAFAQKTTDSTFAPPTEDTLPVVTTPPLEDTLTFLPPLLVTDIPVVAGLPTDPSSQSRFHFISSVTASATPTYGGDNLSPDGASSSPHSTLSPRFALAADVGAAVTVAGNGRRHFDIGLTLGGQYHQGEVLSTDHTVMQGIDGNQPIITTQTEDTYNAFSLYASLPLSFSIAPRDRQSMGWTLSLTPAHSLVSSHMLAPGGFELNPWRLTLGVGILFPSRFPRRASLVANLLPLYTSQPIHEIGIEIGF